MCPFRPDIRSRASAFKCRVSRREGEGGTEQGSRLVGRQGIGGYNMKQDRIGETAIGVHSSTYDVYQNRPDGPFPRARRQVSGDTTPC